MSAHIAYEPVIGLEVHCQLATASKIFCACPVQHGASPNLNTCPVCLGLPGALPVLNARAVQLAVTAALALECTVHPLSIFARKHYFYPDLPKGYQITQYDRPFATGGQVWIEAEAGTRPVPLIRIHLEEDAGKSLHGGIGSRSSLVDLNRAGTPLIEIVSAPALGSAQEAVRYLKALHSVLTSLPVTDGDMEKGNFRCDANVSVRPVGRQTLGTRVELKNLNSFRFLGKAIQYEVDRQVEALQHGETIRQQTRLWDQEHSRTVVMRDKEEAQDYRYLEDPDLPPLVLQDEEVEALRRALPELPRQRALRYQQTLGLSGYDAGVLSADRALSGFFEATLQAGAPARAAASLLTTDVMGLLNREGLSLEQLALSPRALAELLARVDQGELSSKMARAVLEELCLKGGEPGDIISARGLKQVSDEGALDAMLDALLAASPKEAAQARAGKEKLLAFFVGQVMKQTRGQANPALLNALLRRKLGFPEGPTG